MKLQLYPSMMCCDLAHLSKEVKELEKAGIDAFHCDIMDGSFVQNMALGIGDVQAIRRTTSKKIDVHLMIESPARKVDWFIDAGADILYIHPEAERYTIKTLQYIRKRGKEAGIAINPDTTISQIEEMLPHIDRLLVMTVNPGFSGQSFIESMNDKIERLVQLKERYPFVLVMDGACSLERIHSNYKRGVDGFVLGTSALFQEDVDYTEQIQRLRELCDG